MLNRSCVGQALKPYSVGVEKAQLRFFAKATGQTDPVYFDETAAREAGYPNLPVPPTFLFCLETDSPDRQEFLRLAGLDLGRLLHGEQSFVYHRPACAGDILTFEPRITDIYSRRQGSLDFVVRETRVTDVMANHVADLRSIVIQRQPGPAASGTMNAPAHPENTLGKALPTLKLPPVDRAMLALYARASGDHNPIHIDIDFARKAGMSDVFAHGMLSMAFLGRMLTDAVSQHRLLEFHVRFLSIVQLGDQLTCTGEVVEEWHTPSGRRARLALRVDSDAGEVKIVGGATAYLSEEEPAVDMAAAGADSGVSIP